MQFRSLPCPLKQVLFMDSRQCRLGSGHPTQFHQPGLLKLRALPVDILGNTSAPANLSCKCLCLSECLRDTRQGLDGFAHRNQSLLGAPESLVTADPHQKVSSQIAYSPCGD